MNFIDFLRAMKIIDNSTVKRKNSSSSENDSSSEYDSSYSEESNDKIYEKLNETVLIQIVIPSCDKVVLNSTNKNNSEFINSISLFKDMLLRIESKSRGFTHGACAEIIDFLKLAQGNKYIPKKPIEILCRSFMKALIKFYSSSLYTMVLSLNQILISIENLEPNFSYAFIKAIIDALTIVSKSSK
jgi:hypothetical protein